jgi:hypothetical protein
MSRYQDAIIAVLLMGFAGFVAYEASRIPEEYFQRAEGIVYYPLLLSVSLAVASLLLLVRGLMRPRGATRAGNEEELALDRGEQSRARPGDETEAESEELKGDVEGGPAARSFTARVLPVLLGIAILAAYAVALTMVGFIVSTPVMLTALLLAYRVRDWKIIASLSIGTTAVIFLIFYYALKVQLP